METEIASLKHGG